MGQSQCFIGDSVSDNVRCTAHAWDELGLEAINLPLYLTARCLCANQWKIELIVLMKYMLEECDELARRSAIRERWFPYREPFDFEALISIETAIHCLGEYDYVNEVFAVARTLRLDSCITIISRLITLL